MFVNRHHPGGLIFDPELVGRRAAQAVQHGTVTSVDGKVVPLGHDCDVLLLHGDHPTVLENGRALRPALLTRSEAGNPSTFASNTKLLTLPAEHVHEAPQTQNS